MERFIYEETESRLVVHTREDEECMRRIKAALKLGKEVIVHNDYETFYGVGFDKWLRGGLKDVECEITVLTTNHWCGYPWSYKIVAND